MRACTTCNDDKTLFILVIGMLAHRLGAEHVVVPPGFLLSLELQGGEKTKTKVTCPNLLLSKLLSFAVLIILGLGTRILVVANRTGWRPGSKDDKHCIYSLVPRPSLTAFFVAVAKSVVTIFSTAEEKAGRLPYIPPAASPPPVVSAPPPSPSGSAVAACRREGWGRMAQETTHRSSIKA